MFAINDYIFSKLFKISVHCEKLHVQDFEWKEEVKS